MHIPDQLIIEEYLLSEGVDDPRPIQIALKGFGNISSYLKGDLTKRLIEKFVE